MLVQEGRLYRHAGRGTFATAAAGNDRRLRVIGSIDDMMALGDETWFKLVSREVAPVPANIAQALRLPPGSAAYRIVRHAPRRGGPVPARDGLAAAVDRPGALRRGSLETSLIGAIERQLDVPIKFMEQTVDAALAPRQVAELLQLRPRSPLLLFERTYFAASGEPVEHAHHLSDGPPLSRTASSSPASERRS